jgi:uncharacterized membrane protein YccC
LSCLALSLWQAFRQSTYLGLKFLLADSLILPLTVALMLFVDFPGSRSRRLASYLMLALTGALLITLGTLASEVSWLAVASMTVAGFVILFAGALSATIASAGRSALLLFILPVTLPGTAADIAPRLAGWGIAVAVCIPVVMLVWPPRDRDLLRRSAADTCRAAADVITARAGGRATADDELCQAMTRALGRLRDAFRGSTFRPVALTTGSRALIRIVDDLEWLCAGVLALDAHDLPGWPDLAKDTARAAATVLRASAALLAAGRPDPDQQRALAGAMATLGAQRQLVGSQVREFLDPAADHGIELALQLEDVREQVVPDCGLGQTRCCCEEVTELDGVGLEIGNSLVLASHVVLRHRDGVVDEEADVCAT